MGVEAVAQMYMAVQPLPQVAMMLGGTKVSIAAACTTPQRSILPGHPADR